jgi:hypothetical protein
VASGAIGGVGSSNGSVPRRCRRLSRLHRVQVSRPHSHVLGNGAKRSPDIA